MRLRLLLAAASAAALAATAAALAAPRTAPSWWSPSPDEVFQWQLQGTIDQSVAADVYDVDQQETPAGTVASLHAAGRRVVCYVDAGTWESWRPDAAQFPAAVKGKPNGWPGERWLDIRRLDVLGPILQARMDDCDAKGFDAIELDNVDGYANTTGFPLTGADQLTFNRWLAVEAHARGLGVGLKNDLDQIPDLLADFDFELDEQCFRYRECDALTPFVDAGKAVFVVEYSGNPKKFCPKAAALGLRAQKKRLKLDPWRQLCP